MQPDNAIKRSDGKTRSPRHHYLIMAAGVLTLILAGCFIYANSLHASFRFDDYFYILDDYNIQMNELTWPALLHAASSKLPRQRPIPNISFAFNYYFGGYSVTGYHLANIAIHILSAIGLFFFVLKTLILSPAPSASGKPHYLALAAALLWMVIPVNTQSVTYIVQRMTSLAALFYILAMGSYAGGRIVMRADRPIKAVFFFLACGLSGLCAVASKENAATLPLAILLYEWFFFQDIRIQWSKKHLFWTVLIIFAFIGAAFYFTHGDPLRRILNSYARRDFTLPERVMTQFRVIIYYISLLADPSPGRLLLDHDYPLSRAFFHPWTTAVALAAILALLWAAVRSAKKERLAAFCVLWFFLNLLIESSVIGIEIIYEHRTYLPSMMISVLFVTSLFRAVHHKWIAAGCVLGVILLFSAWTYQRNAVWADDMEFWRDCLIKSPNDPRAIQNMGYAVWQTGDAKSAVAYFNRALQKDPLNPKIHLNLGGALLDTHKIDEAIAHFETCLQINPKYFKAYASLGDAYRLKGQPVKAVACYNEALKIFPAYPSAHYRLAQTFIILGETDKALRIFNYLLACDPRNEQLRREMEQLAGHGPKSD